MRARGRNQNGIDWPSRENQIRCSWNYFKKGEHVMTNKPLTRRQAEALEFIKAFLAKNGYPPTVREIAEHMGYHSSSTAFQLLEQLVRKGFVTKGAGPRMLRVVSGKEVSVG
ncbi:hypothetical protein J25TS5_14940 [Paenibacillus faecis]|nr:hypothetical protein J25TS5_14940 [Paenibacillus faecis]